MESNVGASSFFTDYVVLTKLNDFGSVRTASTEPQHAQVAQLVEQRIENPRVGSSILPLGTETVTIPPA